MSGGRWRKRKEKREKRRSETLVRMRGGRGPVFLSRDSAYTQCNPGRLLNDEVSSNDPAVGLPFGSRFEVAKILLRVAPAMQ